MYGQTIDDLDKRILELLLQDSRRSTRSIAKALNRPVSTVHDRIKRLERKGVIKGYTVVLDEKALGYQIKALILVNVVGRHIEEVENDISRYDNVLTVLDITGEFDVALIAVFHNMDELDRFVKNLLKHPYIKQTRTSIAFRTVKSIVNPPI
ncbi:MAG: Lrp/AsnC family transcriptional regulator [Crenarchaeota archaeon]|nr:Lrp/AsnC family transcriptional regulator [Thermoproteota archaeon]